MASMKAHLTSSVSTWICAAALLAVAAAAHADPAQPGGTLTPSLTVRFQDLNTATPEGARVLYGRLSVAAETVCGTRSSLWDAKRYWDWQECVQATLDRAVTRLNLPRLTALHLATRHIPLEQPALHAGNH
jgi:UrcA family protein